MTKEPDCQVFQDQVDALVRGELPDEAVRLLRLHQVSCPDCGSLLAVQEHLASPTLAQLEAAVPPELLASVWPRVAAGARAPAPGGRGPGLQVEPRRRSRFTSWIPALAAASLVLLFANGLLFIELRQSRTREMVLGERLEAGAGSIPLQAGRAPEPGGPNAPAFLADPAWAAALGSAPELTFGEIQAGLEALPGNPTVLSASQAEALLSALGLRAPAPLRSAAAELRNRGGIRARELLRLLESLDLPPNRTIPAARLRELLS